MEVIKNDTPNIVIADIARLVGGRRKVVGSWKWKEKEAQVSASNGYGTRRR